MRPITKRLVAIGFVVAVSLPGLSIFFPASAAEIENRPLQFPEFSMERILDPGFYREALAYLRDANPVRTMLIRIGTGLDFYVFDDSPNPTRVFKGRDDWLFFRDTIEAACSEPPGVVVDNFDSFVNWLEQDVATVVVTVAPSKFMIHPEHMTENQFRLTECARTASLRLQELLDGMALNHYVDGWTLFAEAKAAGMQPYFRTDTHFTYEASIGWMEALVAEIAPVWDESAVQNRGGIDFDGNLMTFLGLTLPERVDLFVVDRGFETDVDDSLPGRATRYLVSGGEEEVIRGKTLIIGDSFMVIPEPSLVQYFEDVMVFDWRQPDAVDVFLAEAPDADQIILEVSELDIWHVFADGNLADRYKAQR